MQKLALLGSSLALAAGALALSHTSHAADHLDAPATKMMANQMADIADVYAWMTSDAAKVNLAMTVSPADQGTNAFGPSVEYAFHVTSHPGASNVNAFGKPGTETDLICTFASNTSAQCWVVQGGVVKDYVTGNPSSAMTSEDGKLKVFAGRRSDPFFFNLGGFLTAVLAVEAGPLPGGDAAGCPAVTASTAGMLRAALSSPPAQIGPCVAGVADCFANFNVMAIVAQVDKTLLLQTGGTTPDHLVSVWGSTHAKQN